MEQDKDWLEDLKKIEVDMLQAFITVCDKLGLRYYLIGGSLLGAVRHAGFIPWDDDIDVAMPREDYERFLKEAQKLLPEYIFVQTHETDPNFWMNYCKLRHTNTTFIEIPVRKHKINHGVFLDIFPLDHYTNNVFKQKVFRLQKYLLTMRIGRVFDLKQRGWGRFKQILARIPTCFLSIERAFQKRERLFKKYPKGQLLANHGGAWGQKEIMPKEWFSDIISINFETIQVNIPKEYDKMLTRVYGNYMMLPPIEKRVAHHFCTIIDLKNSYKKYLGDEEK